MLKFKAIAQLPRGFLPYEAFQKLTLKQKHCFNVEHVHMQAFVSLFFIQATEVLFKVHRHFRLVSWHSIQLIKQNSPVWKINTEEAVIV